MPIESYGSPETAYNLHFVTIDFSRNTSDFPEEDTYAYVVAKFSGYEREGA